MKCIPWKSKVRELKIRLNSVWAFFFCCNQLFVFLAVPNDVCVYQAEWITFYGFTNFRRFFELLTLSASFWESSKIDIFFIWKTPTRLKLNAENLKFCVYTIFSLLPRVCHHHRFRPPCVLGRRKTSSSTKIESECSHFHDGALSRWEMLLI